MYECVVCQSLNHQTRLHCQNCGAVPRQYSVNGKCSISVAQGSVRACSHHAERIYLRTVSGTYYADGE